MEKNQQTQPQQNPLRQEPSDVTGTPAYRPVNEGDAIAQPATTEQHSESSRPQGENETLGTP